MNAETETYRTNSIAFRQGIDRSWNWEIVAGPLAGLYGGKERTKTDARATVKRAINAVA